jgi:hypothetical protein
VNLGALMATGSDRMFIIDDKLFTMQYVTTPNFNIQQFDLTAKISESVNQYGLRTIGFDLTGPFVDGGPNDQTVQDMNLQYKVEVLPEFWAQGVRLIDAHLAFNGVSGGTGSFARVAETIFETDTGNLIGNLNTFYNFGPPSSIQMFFANTPGGFSSCSFVRQEFSQIPAPGAVGLLGVAGLFAHRRRRA